MAPLWTPAAAATLRLVSTTTEKRKWLGGYVRIDTAGRPTYLIERKVAGVRYHVSTRCHTERAALAELARFEKDPEAYRGGGRRADRVVLDEDLAARFLADHAENTPEYLTRQRALLAWWAEQLGDLDLRKVTLRGHIRPALDAAGGEAMRIALIKRLYSWLRERDLIEASEDPTLGKLKMPQARAAQVERSKVIPAASYEAARAHLIGTYRDILDLLAGTGWHLTEAHRFAAGGAVLPYAGTQAGVAAVLEVKHKNGSPHRTGVSEAVAEAARRVRATGSFSKSRFHRAVLSACRAAGVPPFRPGWFRHTIATIATEAGEENLVPGFLGHRSATTTRRHYNVHATPPKVRTLK